MEAVLNFICLLHNLCQFQRFQAVAARCRRMPRLCRLRRVADAVGEADAATSVRVRIFSNRRGRLLLGQVGGERRNPKSGNCSNNLATICECTRPVFQRQDFVFCRLEKIALRRQCGAVIACLRMRQASQFEQFADFFSDGVFAPSILSSAIKSASSWSDAHADWDTVRCIHIRLF